MSETENDARPAPDGWTLQSHTHTFSGVAGPYYFRESGAPPGVGFFAEERHANLGGVVHGGALLTLADMALFDICFRELGLFKAVTVTLNSEFLGPGKIGAFIEATGEITRAGKSLVFLRGMVTSEGAAVMSFSGVIKRVR